MADRTVSVTLRAQVVDFVRGMHQAATATDAAKRATEKSGEAYKRHAETMQRAGVAFSVFGGAVLAGLTIAVKASAEFGAKMAQLQSLTHSTQGEMKQFADAAMTSGQAFGQSATDVAEAEIELAKAGITVKEQLGGALPGALALAAAGQIDVADATSIAATAMTQFSLKGKDIPHVADLLAAGADKALGSVDDLGMALKQGGLVASQFGLSVEDTVGTLSAFANAGLIGSDAGTSFKTMLTQLAAPSHQAQELLDKYNITLNDSKGNFIGITGLAGQLREKLGGLTQAQRNAALATIFGTDAVRAANVLYKEDQSGIQGWIEKVDDTGFAAEQAAGKMNSLQGDVQKLAAAFQTDLIKLGGAASGPLRGLTQTLTGALEIFGKLDPDLQSVTVAAGTAVAAIALVGGAALIATPKVVALDFALKGMGTSLKGLTKTTAIIGGFVAISAAAAYAAKKVGDLNYQIQKQQKQSDRVASTAQQASVTSPNTNTGNSGVGYGIGAMLDKQAAAEHRLARATHDSRTEAELNASAKKRTVAAATQAGRATTVEAAALQKLQGSAAKAGKELDALENTIEGFGSATLDARGAQRKLQQSIDDATKTIKANGRATDISTQKGRDNQEALDGIAESAKDAAAKTLHLTGSTKDAAAQMQIGRAAFIRAAEAAGYTSKKAQALADDLGLIPKNVKTAVGLTGYDSTVAQIGTVTRQLKGLDGKSATVTVHYRADGSAEQAQGKRILRAAGGEIPGSGPKGIDSVPVLAAPGEHMWTASEVDAVGGQAAMYRLRAAARAGALPRYASGGAVPRYSTGPAGSAAASSGGVFTGDLYLDSGEFLGKVRGEVNSGIARNEHAKRLRVPR